LKQVVLNVRDAPPALPEGSDLKDGYSDSDQLSFSSVLRDRFKSFSSVKPLAAGVKCPGGERGPILRDGLAKL